MPRLHRTFLSAAILCGALCLPQMPYSPANGQEAPTVDTDKKPDNLPAGINDGFLDPNMDPEDYIKRFEVESREVFACRDQIMAALNLEPGMAVADVGAGTGLYMRALSRAVGEEGKVYAIDIAPNFVKHLRQRSKDEELENVQVVLCSDRDVNLAPNSVDRVFICDVYHHFEYPLSSMKSIYRSLRPGGELVLIDFYREKEGLDEDRAKWLYGHIRDSQDVFKQEIIDAGFIFDKEVEIEGFQENYLLRFKKP